MLQLIAAAELPYRFSIWQIHPGPPLGPCEECQAPPASHSPAHATGRSCHPVPQPPGVEHPNPILQPPTPVLLLLLLPEGLFLLLLRQQLVLLLLCLCGCRNFIAFVQHSIGILQAGRIGCCFSPLEPTVNSLECCKQVRPCDEGGTQGPHLLQGREWAHSCSACLSAADRNTVGNSRAAPACSGCLGSLITGCKRRWIQGPGMEIGEGGWDTQTSAMQPAGMTAVQWQCSPCCCTQPWL